MREGRRAECRNAHVLHCLLKIILSADLLPLLELGSTNNANSEIRGKTAPKPWKKIRAMSWPACSQTLSMGRNFSPLFFWFSRSFCHFGPKVSKSAKTNGKAKTKSFTPCPVSSFSDLSMGRNFLFFFVFFVFSRFSLLCQSNNVSCSFFFGFWVSCFLGSWEKSSPWQTSIGTAFTPPHFILISSLSYFFGYWAIRENVQ